MAWPCISRVCCLARFWNQLDKSDLAVPLTIHNYSDIEEPGEEGAEGGGGGGGGGGGSGGGGGTPRVPTGGGSRPPPAHPRAASMLPASASAPSLQESLVAVKRPSKKAGGGGGAPHPRKAPFAAETQYQQDFRAWPVQKRDALPWIGDGSRRVEAPGAPPGTGSAAAAAPAPAPSSQVGLSGGSQVYVLPTAGQEVGSEYSGFKQVWPSASPPGAPKITSSYRREYRPWTGAKRSRPTKTTQGFIIPEDHFAQESSYKADFKIPEVKAKFSPNPSAVFQAPSRILNV